MLVKSLSVRMRKWKNLNAALVLLKWKSRRQKCFCIYWIWLMSVICVWAMLYWLNCLTMRAMIMLNNDLPAKPSLGLAGTLQGIASCLPSMMTIGDLQDFIPYVSTILSKKMDLSIENLDNVIDAVFDLCEWISQTKPDDNNKTKNERQERRIESLLWFLNTNKSESQDFLSYNQVVRMIECYHAGKASLRLHITELLSETIIKAQKDAES